MTMMADNRVCAKAVSAMMTSLPKEKAPVTRVVQHIRRAYVFGHYDSRGGATLVAAPSIGKAMAKYQEVFCMDANGDDPGQKAYFASTGLSGQALEDRYEDWKSEMMMELEEELLFACEVWVCDEMLPADGGELDDNYRYEEGRFYKYGVLEMRYKNSSSKRWGEETTKTLVLWKATACKPTIIKQDQFYNYRLTKTSYGEDACGLIYMP